MVNMWLRSISTRTHFIEKEEWNQSGNICIILTLFSSKRFRMMQVDTFKQTRGREEKNRETPWSDEKQCNPLL